MKQLTCEMCGSTDLIKQDGVFVCQSCGTKYSIEEAKKMMVEGTVEIVGTVRIDNSGSYDKFIGLAKDAFEDSRYESAYDYCSKALDVNAENPEMILLQGLSLLGKEEFGKNIPVGCTNAVETYLKKASSFEWGAETAQKFETAIQYVNSVCDYKISELDAKIAEIRVDLRPTRGVMDILADLGRPAFVASQNQAEDKKIELHNKQVQGKINAVQAKVNTIVGFQKETTEQLSALGKVKSEEASKKRFDEYWAAHVDEKSALECEKKNLDEQISQNNASFAAQRNAYEKEINSIPEAKDVTELEEKAKKLAADKQALGFFKGKEKKSIQMQIDEIEVKKAQVCKVVSKKTDEFQQKINAAQEETQEKNAPLLTRVKEIESELTKER